MKNLETLKQKYKELVEEIEKIEAEKSWPSDCNEYWFIDSYGDVEPETWGGCDSDRHRLQTRNIFRTRENAELWLKINNRVHELIGDWKPDWDSYNNDKWYLFVGAREKRVFCSGVPLGITQGVTYMPEHATETLIEEFGDELKIWICGEDI